LNFGNDPDIRYWLTQPRGQQLVAIVAAVKGKGGKKEEAPTAVRGIPREVTRFLLLPSFLFGN
jgi:hypothetical protein